MDIKIKIILILIKPLICTALIKKIFTKKKTLLRLNLLAL